MMKTMKSVVGASLLMLLLAGCGEESRDNVADFFGGCNTGKLNNDYPQSEAIDCLVNIENGIVIDNEGQSTVGVQFSASGRELYTLSSGLQKWDSETWEEIGICEQENPELCHGSLYETLYFSRENGPVGIQYSGNTYGGTTPENGIKIVSSFERKQGVMQRFDYVDGWDSFIHYDDQTIRFFDRRTGELVNEQEEPYGIQLMEGGSNYYATALGDGRIIVLPTSEAYNGVLLEGHEAFMSTMMFSDDNTQLVSIDADGMLFIWDLESGAVLQKIEVDVGNIELAPGLVWEVEMDLSADNELLLVKRTGGYLTFYATASGEIIAETKMSGTILDLDISPDRTKLALGYASKRTEQKRDLNSNEQNRNRTTDLEVTEIRVSRGPAVILDISGINP